MRCTLTTIWRRGWRGQVVAARARPKESEENISLIARLAKVAIAELAESAIGHICRVVGGGSYSRHSPYGYWFEDVRALGFLRPPWGLAYGSLFDLSWGDAATNGVPAATRDPAVPPAGPMPPPETG